MENVSSNLVVQTIDFKNPGEVKKLRLACRRFIISQRQRNSVFAELYKRTQTLELIEIELAFLLSKAQSSQLLIKYTNEQIARTLQDILVSIESRRQYRNKNSNSDVKVAA